jgi:hypothetical protein
MIEKSEKEVKDKKQYVSVCVETILLDEKDVITASIGDHDVNKDDIFD